MKYITLFARLFQNKTIYIAFILMLSACIKQGICSTDLIHREISDPSQPWQRHIAQHKPNLVKITDTYSQVEGVLSNIAQVVTNYLNQAENSYLKKNPLQPILISFISYKPQVQSLKDILTQTILDNNTLEQWVAKYIEFDFSNKGTSWVIERYTKQIYQDYKNESVELLSWFKNLLKIPPTYMQDHLKTSSEIEKIESQLIDIYGYTLPQIANITNTKDRYAEVIFYNTTLLAARQMNELLRLKVYLRSLEISDYLRTTAPRDDNVLLNLLYNDAICIKLIPQTLNINPHVKFCDYVSPVLMEGPDRIPVFVIMNLIQRKALLQIINKQIFDNLRKAHPQHGLLNLQPKYENKLLIQAAKMCYAKDDEIDICYNQTIQNLGIKIYDTDNFLLQMVQSTLSLGKLVNDTNNLANRLCEIIKNYSKESIQDKIVIGGDELTAILATCRSLMIYIALAQNESKRINPTAKNGSTSFHFSPLMLEQLEMMRTQVREFKTNDLYIKLQKINEKIDETEALLGQSNFNEKCDAKDLESTFEVFHAALSANVLLKSYLGQSIKNLMLSISKTYSMAIQKTAEIEKNFKEKGIYVKRLMNSGADKNIYSQWVQARNRFASTDLLQKESLDANDLDKDMYRTKALFLLCAPVLREFPASLFLENFNTILAANALRIADQSKIAIELNNLPPSPISPATLMEIAKSEKSLKDLYGFIIDYHNHA